MNGECYFFGRKVFASSMKYTATLRLLQRQTIQFSEVFKVDGRVADFTRANVYPRLKRQDRGIQLFRGSIPRV